ncbi:MAG: zf-TFIIB domain-containing protein [Sphingomonadaceae bacterium]
MTNAAVGMPCPVCKVALVMSERSGIEIDYCPQCRGVWLDRGELDKILERSSDAPAPAPRQPAPPPPQGYPAPGYGGTPQYPYGKRKKSFFDELFD